MTRIDGEIRVHHRDRIDFPGRGQERVDDGGQPPVEPAVAPHQADPGIDAQQERRPERQDDEEQQNVAPDSLGARYAQRHGIAEKQAECGRNQRVAERGEIAAEIDVSENSRSKFSKVT